MHNMKQETALFNIMDIEHEVPVKEGNLVLNATILNELRHNKKGFNLVVGGFSFLGEGSGPFENGDDKDPERRAETTGDLVLAGWFNTLDDAEEAGEAAISSKGYFGVFGDSYVVPEAANMRFIE